MLIFVPLSTAELAAWADAGSLRPRVAYGVTGPMRDAFGFAAADDEDAEHTALHIAGLDALATHGRRLVAVLEADGRPVSDSDMGEVRVGEQPWRLVTALFADADGDPAAADLAATLSGRPIDEVWDAEPVGDFVSAHELAWHGPQEWRRLLGQP